jgi:hypothetical protein
MALCALVQSHVVGAGQEDIACTALEEGGKGRRRRRRRRWER